jgi:hypothetical protein
MLCSKEISFLIVNICDKLNFQTKCVIISDKMSNLRKFQDIRIMSSFVHGIEYFKQKNLSTFILLLKTNLDTID